MANHVPREKESHSLGTIEKPWKETYTGDIFLLRTIEFATVWLSAADTIEIDAEKGHIFEITADRNIHFENFDGAYHNQRIIIKHQQDGTGTWQPTFGSAFDMGNFGTIVTTKLPGAMDYLAFIVDNRRNKIDLVALSLGHG